MNRNDLLTLAQRLREYNHNPHHINPTSEAFHKLIDEAASALSILATPPADAADMGGQAGEEVEVVAYRHWGDASRLIPRIGKDRALPDSYADEFTIPLMTVAQHRQQAGKLVEALRGCLELIDVISPLEGDEVRKARAALSAHRESQP